MAAFTVRTVCMHVDLELVPPCLLGVAHVQGADVGDDDVDAAQRLGRVGDPGLQRRLVGDVERRAVRGHALGPQRRHGRLDLAGIAGADRDVGALVGEDVGAAPADALAAAGDDGALARWRTATRPR